MPPRLDSGGNTRNAGSGVGGVEVKGKKKKKKPETCRIRQTDREISI